jgi:hypothetical protein
MTGNDEHYLVTDVDLLAEVDLVSPDEMLGSRRGPVVRDSGVRCGRPVVYPVGPDDLPSTLRRRAKTSASRYYGLLLAFDLLPLQDGYEYTRVTFSVALTDKRIIALELEHDPALSAAPVLRVSPVRAGWLDRLRHATTLRTAVSGILGPRFAWTYSDSGGETLRPRSYVMHAWLEAPDGATQLDGTLSVEADVSRTMFGYTAGHAAQTRKEVLFTEPLAGEGAQEEGWSVRLCLAVDVEKYSRHLTEGAERAQERLVTALERTLDFAQVNQSQILVQDQGDGRFMIFPASVDEAKVIPALVTGLRAALTEVNQDLSRAARMRLRVALDRGQIKRGRSGFVGNVAIAVHRIVDAPQTRQALASHPRSDFVLAISDYLYQDVASHEYDDLDPNTFRRTELEIEGKNYSGIAWLYVPAE